MALDQQAFRSILAKITSISSEFIVPKQGNWFNPQDILVDGKKPDTWIAFKVRQGKPITLPMTQPMDETGDKWASVTWFKGQAEVQFLGVHGEAYAQNVPHWVHRDDVKAAFRDIGAELMASETGYKSDSYYQDGLNTVLAYRVTLNILHSNVVELNKERWSTSVPGRGLFV
jgi:hypothetical protein